MWELRGKGHCSVSSTVISCSPFHRHGIRCNSVLPGFITTPMTQKVPQKVLDKVGHGWRAESRTVQRPASLGLRERENAGHGASLEAGSQ